MLPDTSGWRLIAIEISLAANVRNELPVILRSYWCHPTRFRSARRQQPKLLIFEPVHEFASC